MGTLLEQCTEILRECRMLIEAVKRCDCREAKCATCMSNLDRVDRKLKVVAGG